MTTSILFFAIAFSTSLIGVSLFRRLSLRRGFFDIPNERSSHSTPTPLGGGLVIVIVCLVFYLVIGFAFGLPVSWGYFLGALIVASVSWLDDLYSLPFWSRLIAHASAAGVLMFDLGSWSEVFVPLISANVILGNIFGVIVTGIWIVWFLNAYNFMDGIDGIAALQAVVSSVAWAVFALAFDLNSTFFLSGVLAASSAGFLVYNWQPAKIFMGDVGSAFLGFTLAAMPLLARNEAPTDIPVLPVVAVLFVWIFVFDTIFTFFRRVLSKKRIWEAHREHIYQKLIIEGKKHYAVTLMYGSAGAILSLSVFLALFFSGVYPFFAILSFTGLTLGLTYLGIRKNVDANN